MWINFAMNHLAVWHCQKDESRKSFTLNTHLFDVYGMWQYMELWQYLARLLTNMA